MGNNSNKDADTKNKVEVTDKPLGQTALRSLTKLVNNDFESLRAKVQSALAQQRDERLKEIEAAYPDATLAAAKAEVVTLARDLEDQVSDFKAKLEDRGFTYTNNYYGLVSIDSNPDYLVLSGKSDAVAKVERAYNRSWNRAANVIAQEHRDVERQLLLQAVGAGEAKNILDRLPDTDAVLVTLEDELKDTDDLSVLATSFNNNELPKGN